MAHWQPTGKLRLTLKQLGFHSAQVQHAISAYRAQETDRPNDRSFTQFLQRSVEPTDTQHHHLQTLAQVPLGWRASTAAVNTLRKQGFSEEAIGHYTAVFVLATREKAASPGDGDRAFIAFCQHRPRLLPKSLPHDWVPGVATLTNIRHATGLAIDAITDQIPGFIRCHRYSVERDWDARFVQWVQDRCCPGFRKKAV